MDISRRFSTALARARSTGTDPQSLPCQLAQAAARALDVDGIGLTVIGDQPISLGASDEVAAIAEQLQFTLGVGPCMQSVATQFPIFATESFLQQQWPIFHDLLRSRTAYRSAVAYPLGHGLAGLGAMVVYLRSPAGPLDFDSSDAQAVSNFISTELTTSQEWANRHQPGTQRWLDTPTAQRRSATWQAVGMISQGLTVSITDALALLRGRAYATGTLIDDTARAVVTGQLPVHQMHEDTT